MRIAAVYLPELRVEWVRASGALKAGEEGRPLAIVVADPPLNESNMLGNTRLDGVSREARALGVKPGQTMAAARACAPGLKVVVVRPDAVRSVLERLAEVSLAFGATVSFSAASESVDSYGDLIWVDVTGCAHLHASKPVAGEPRVCESGEDVLATRLAQVFTTLGHKCTVAIADGPRIAAMVARTLTMFASSGPTMRRSTEKEVRRVVVIKPGTNAVSIAPLPITSLPLTPDEIRWLTKIGVRTISEFRALPRSALGMRLGSRAAVLLSLAEGEDRAPLTPHVPPEIPEESTTFEYGIEGSEALTFVAKMLTDRLAVRLAGRAVAVARLEFDLMLDVASVQSEEIERTQQMALDLPQALSHASDLLAALRPRIERTVLRAPVLGATLRAAALVHKPQASLALFEPMPQASLSLPRLVAELVADLGGEAVGKLALGDAWIPEDRSRFVRLDTKTQSSGEKGKRRRHILSTAPEPTRLLSQPMPVSRSAVRIVRHLSRIEAANWWKNLPGERPSRGVDYVYAWVEDAPAWVEMDRASGATRIRGWFD